MSKEDNLIKKPITKRTLLLYTAVFLAMSVLIYGYFVGTGRSFIWDGDGFSQHYLLFYDYVDKLQGIFKGEGFQLWDWSIGMGADTITSYGYYVIGDPFVYLGVLFPPSQRELAYHVLIFLRMWCVGGSFLLYARKMLLSHGAGLLGSVMYAFSHYVIYNVTRHPFFILPMICYPLLCLGVEKIFRNESGVLFVFMITASAMANFYFFYKLTLLAVLYGVVRYSSLYSFRDRKKVVRIFWRCVYLYMIGVLMSAVLFLPMVDGFLSSSRSPEGAPINMLYYPLSYYYLQLLNLFTPGTYLWTVGGFSFFSLIASIFLWRRRKKKDYRFVFLALVVLGLFTLFPFFGSLMNGLAGPYNRFTFTLPFYLALASGHLFDKRKLVEKKDLYILTYCLLFFTVFYVIHMVISQMVLFYLLPILVGWGMWGVLAKEQSTHASSWFKKSASSLLIALVGLNMTLNAMIFYYPFGKNAMADTMDYRESEEAYENLFNGLETMLPEDELYRVGVTSRDNHVKNQFVYLDLMGLNSYLSITDGDLAEFAYELESGSFQVIQPLRNGFDDRQIVNHLLGVRYIITEVENETYLPFGYDVIYQTKKEPAFIIAETQHAYPFMYVENTWMPQSDFSALNPVEKEAYLAEGVVLEDGNEVPGMQQYKGKLSVETIPFEMNSVDTQINQTGKETFEWLEEEGQLTLTFENPEDVAGKQLYVHLEGLEYKPLTESVLYAQDTSYRARVIFGEQEKSIFQSDRYSFSSYFHRKNMLFHMGYTEEVKETVRLQFDDTGKYRVEDVTLYALPVNEERDEAVASEKSEQALEILTFEDEKIEGETTRSDSGLLVTSIPYSAGWKTYVNGERVETVKTNIGFIGIPLPAGHSEVLFTYHTPLLTLGLLISLVGVVLLVVYRFVLYPKRSLLI